MAWAQDPASSWGPSRLQRKTSRSSGVLKTGAMALSSFCFKYSIQFEFRMERKPAYWLVAGESSRTGCFESDALLRFRRRYGERIQKGDVLLRADGE